MFELFFRFNGADAVYPQAKKKKDSQSYSVAARNPNTRTLKPLGEIDFEEDEGVAVFMRRMIETLRGRIRRLTRSPHRER
jgi:hypothetical protein